MKFVASGVALASQGAVESERKGVCWFCVVGKSMWGQRLHVNTLELIGL